MMTIRTESLKMVNEETSNLGRYLTALRLSRGYSKISDYVRHYKLSCSYIHYRNIEKARKSNWKMPKTCARNLRQIQVYSIYICSKTCCHLNLPIAYFALLLPVKFPALVKIWMFIDQLPRHTVKSYGKTLLSS